MNNYQEVIASLLTTVLTVTVPILLRYIVVWVNAKIAAVTSETQQKYLKMAVDAIYTATLETTQTYVENLKDQNIFDEEAQKKALQMSIDRAKEIMGEKTRTMLESIVGDINAYITSQIESMISMQPRSFMIGEMTAEDN